MFIKKGSRGPEVKKIQEKLGLVADGVFGAITEKKVKEWQRDNGLKPDGLIGKKTWAAMFPPEVIEIPPSDFALEKLVGHIPNEVLAQIPDTAKKFNITTPLRLAHFLAQCGHESGNWRAVSENLNYSSRALKSIFGKYFPGNLNESYARQPEKIASRVYGGRMGNGEEETGEGWKFRGRGYIQLTGKNNYSKFDSFVDDDILGNPDLVAEKYPLMSAAFFFDSNNLWSTCDQGDSVETVRKVTRRVNGGYHGLEDRISKFKKYWSLLK
jgi:putative chitinase